MKILLFICLSSSLIYGSQSQEDYQLMPDETARVRRSLGEVGKAPTGNSLYLVTQETKSEHVKVSHYQRNSSSDSSDSQECPKNKPSHRRQGGGWIESLFAGWGNADLSEGLKATKTSSANYKY